VVKEGTEAPNSFYNLAPPPTFLIRQRAQNRLTYLVGDRRPFNSFDVYAGNEIHARFYGSNDSQAGHRT